MTEGRPGDFAPVATVGQRNGWPDGELQVEGPWTSAQPQVRTEVTSSAACEYQATASGSGVTQWQITLRLPPIICIRLTWPGS